jgi:hypothetical protein
MKKETVLFIILLSVIPMIFSGCATMPQQCCSPQNGPPQYGPPLGPYQQRPPMVYQPRPPSVYNAPMPSSNVSRDATLGGLLGAVLGGAIDKNNRWRGAMIGAAAGTVTGTIVGLSLDQMRDRAVREAAQYNRPAGYVDDQGHKIQATPVPASYSPQTRCKLVRSRVWEGDKLLEDKDISVCN